MNEVTSERILHDERVKIIGTEIRNHVISRNGKKLRFKHGGTNTTSSTRNKEHNDWFIDISSLHHIIEINLLERYVLVEPCVPMDALVVATLKHGMTPPVVTEFPGITVGGAVQGAALESSSYKWGQFNDTGLEYEVITGRGERVIASPNSHADLFFGLSGSYGSLGLLTLVKLSLIPVEKFVLVKYHQSGGYKDVLLKIRKETENQGNDFVEGLVFSPDNSVVITGHYCDAKDISMQTFTNAGDPWFWRHSSDISQKYIYREELVPIRDYLFRYDRGAFWMGEYALSRFFLPSNYVTRLILDFFMRTRKLYEILHAAHASQSYFIQDAYVSFDHGVDCLEYTEKNLGIFPVWLCPVKSTQLPQKLSPHTNSDPLLLDIGIWGKTKESRRDHIDVNREFEKFVAEKGGKKMLYAETFYSESEFWRIYDKKWYAKLRADYHADKTFPDVWQKTHVPKRYKENLIAGGIKLIINAIRRRFR